MILPKYADLSPEQDQILNLPLDENHLITGAPGTGKSIMALYRAQALVIDDRKPMILTYSNVLHQYTVVAAAGLGLRSNLTTFHRWFRQFWRETYGTDPPTHRNEAWAYDWTAIATRFLTDPPPQGSAGDLILDEGQDLPVGFYRLASRFARTITVFADEYQQIRDEQSTLKDIQSAIGAPRHHQLPRNSRNTREIATLANHFYVGSPDHMPKLPDRTGPKPTLCRFRNLEEFANSVIRYARTHPKLRVGVAIRHSKRQLNLLNHIKKRDAHLSVQTYISGKQGFNKVNFTEPGIMVVNYASLKGIEFDTLFVPDLQLISGDLSSASVQMLFYVVMSRARHELHLSWTGNGAEPPIIAELESSVLQRN